MAVSVLKNIICNVPLYKYHSSHKIFSLCGKIFVRYAGHSHWQNVKGTKQAKDLMKNQMYNKYIFLMRKAVYGANGNANPDVNMKLAEVINAAKKSNMAISTINNVLKRLAEKRSQSIWLELKGPNRVSAIVLLYGDKKTHLTNVVKAHVKRSCFTVADTVSMFAFDRKGYITAVPSENLSTDAANSKSLDDAIEVGAEEVEPIENTDPQNFQFVCNADEINMIKSKLEKMGYIIMEAEECFEPKYTVELDEKQIQEIDEAYSKLENIPEFEKVYDNVVR